MNDEFRLTNPERAPDEAAAQPSAAERSLARAADQVRNLRTQGWVETPAPARKLLAAAQVSKKFHTYVPKKTRYPQRYTRSWSPAWAVKLSDAMRVPSRVLVLSWTDKVAIMEAAAAEPAIHAAILADYDLGEIVAMLRGRWR